jgi:hypothetical protein
MSGWVRHPQAWPSGYFMALKDLLVYVDQTESSLVRLRLAADLAVRHGSRLIALYAREWNRAQLDWRLVSADRARAVARCIGGAWGQTRRNTICFFWS